MSWILVTGGGQGLGAAICQELASLGHPLVIHYRENEKEAKKSAEIARSSGVLAEIIQGDFSSAEEVALFVEKYQNRFHSTKAIIHNVGNYLIRSLLETTSEELKTLFQTNFFASFAITRALLPTLIQTQGSVIHIGESGLAKGPKRKAPAYFMSKQALFQMTRSLALELAPYGVKVNMISPGVLENSVDLDQTFLPMGRSGKLEEVATCVSFLLQNPYITGQNIEIAGGFGL